MDQRWSCFLESVYQLVTQTPSFFKISQDCLWCVVLKYGYDFKGHGQIYLKSFSLMEDVHIKQDDCLWCIGFNQFQFANLYEFLMISSSNVSLHGKVLKEMMTK